MFKIGQIVEYSGKAFAMSATKGAKAFVCGVSHLPKYVDVIWIDGLRNHQSNGSYYPEHFEILKSKPNLKYLKKFLKQKTITNLEYLEALHDRKEVK